MHVTSIGKSGYSEYLEKEASERALWQGKAAEKLELSGKEVTREDFKLLCAGIDPVHGEVLRPREQHSITRDDRVWGSPTAVYDATIFAPKSVSALAVIDERISPAHQASVREVLPPIESLAAVRRDRQIFNTGNAIYAAFDHHSNRALDPHEHTHVAVMNLTYDPVKEKWRALAAYDIYRAGTPIQELYRERLGERLSLLGYRMQEESREVEGVSPAIIAKFSEREKQISDGRQEFYDRFERWPDKKEMNVVVRSHRDKKPELPLEEIRERQLAILEPAEREQLVTVKERAFEQGEKIHLPRLQDSVESEEALEYRPWRYAERTKERQRLGV
jgi:conjugative relaxase-like TrwC/TraI family protein